VWLLSVYGLVHLGEEFNIWKMSTFGPIGYAFIGGQCGINYYSDNMLIMLLIVGGGYFFVPLVFYCFGIIWRNKNDLFWK
jgi:hypothetical protein